MPFDFTGKKILITGAGRGIGRALALEIAKNGGEVYALSRTKETLDSLAKESKRIHPIICDVSDWDGTRDVLERLDAMDGVVNNAAKVLGAYVSALECPKENIERYLNVNIMAVINVIQATGKKMVAAGKGGSIVNISSIISLNPIKGALGFDVSKAGLDMVTKQFALELGPHQIRVNSLNPTRVNTENVPKIFQDAPEAAEALKCHTPMGRFVTLQECIDPIMYLLSEQSGMVTGTMHVLDGGLLSCIPV